MIYITVDIMYGMKISKYDSTFERFNVSATETATLFEDSDFKMYSFIRSTKDGTMFHIVKNSDKLEATIRTVMQEATEQLIWEMKDKKLENVSNFGISNIAYSWQLGEEEHDNDFLECDVWEESTT